MRGCAMASSRIAWIVLSVALAGMLLAGCEKIDPSKPLETVPTRVALREMPHGDVYGIVRDQSGGPLAEARIALGVGQEARTVLTSMDGSYRLSDLAAGAYVITASREGYLSGRVRVVLEGTAVSGADIVLEPYRAAVGHRSETVEVTAEGALVQPWTIRSEGTGDVPAVELRLTEGTVLREASGRIVSDPVEIRVTPMSGRSLVAPTPGTFGVTDADLEVVPGEPAVTRMDLPLDEGRVAEDVEIVDPNPLFGVGARVRLVQPMAAFVLEPEGLLLENPDGTPRSQQVVFGNLPFGGRLSPGTTVDLVDPEGNMVTGTVGTDGRSIEAEVTRLTRYDLLVQVQMEVQETALYVSGAPKPVAAATVIVVSADGITVTFPELDENDPYQVALAQFIVNAIANLLKEECDPGEGCTPGFWKQQHVYSWVTYKPEDSYEAVFGVAVPGGAPTLLEALGDGGGDIDALLRHSTAALLNASNPDVDYAYTVANIIAMVQDAFATGDYEIVKDIFETENERGGSEDVCGGGDGITSRSWIVITVVTGEGEFFVYAVVDRWVCRYSFIVEHEQGFGW